MKKQTKRKPRPPKIRHNYREELETLEGLQILADRRGTDVSTLTRAATYQYLKRAGVLR